MRCEMGGLTMSDVFEPRIVVLAGGVSTVKFLWDQDGLAPLLWHVGGRLDWLMLPNELCL